MGSPLHPQQPLALWSGFFFTVTFFKKLPNVLKAWQISCYREFLTLYLISERLTNGIEVKINPTRCFQAIVWSDRLKCPLRTNETARDFCTNKDKIIFVFHHIEHFFCSIFIPIDQHFVRAGGEQDQILSTKVAPEHIFGFYLGFKITILS